MSRPSAPPIPLTAWQLTALILAVTFLGAPAAHGVVRALGWDAEETLWLSQVLAFWFGGTAIACVPWLRKRTAALLAAPCPRSRYGEVALAVAVAGMGEFAIYGLRVAVRWIDGGDVAIAGISLGPSNTPDAAFSTSTLRHLVITSLMAPLIEEIFYRGTLFEAFAGRHRAAVAMLLSSAVFASVHPTALHAFFGGVLLCAVYLRTGALRAAILVHFCANAFNWYPLLGQFLIPAENHGIRSWTFQLVCLATAPLFVVGYAWLAVQSRRPASEDSSPVLA